MIKLTLKQWAIVAAIAFVFGLLLLVGWQSQRLKQLLTDLLIAKQEAETQKLRIQVDQARKKVKETDAKRQESAAKYRDYMRRRNGK